jgi:hypothetical protein
MVRSVAAGYNASCAAAAAGELLTWGEGDSGQLGHGDTADQHVPKRVDDLEGENGLLLSRRAVRTPLRSSRAVAACSAGAMQKRSACQTIPRTKTNLMSLVRCASVATPLPAAFVQIEPVKVKCGRWRVLRFGVQKKTCRLAV